MNANQKEFSQTVIEGVGNYVYRLVDPRNGETFYVGAGRANRVFAHARGELAEPEDDETGMNIKIARIRDIRNAGLDVVHIIHRHEIPEHAVFEVEAAVIDAFPGLTNEQGGHGSSSKGPMHVQQIIDKYDLPTLEEEPPEKLILINVNLIEERDNPYMVLDHTRYCWRISRNRAEQADYVLSVMRGVVIGAFVVNEWLDANPENFPELERADSVVPKRLGFRGHPVDDETWQRFVGERGKRIVNDQMKHIRFPIRYWNL